MDETNHTNKDAEREAADEKMVNEAFDRLLESYLNSPHRRKVDIITKAFHFARQAHKGVRRLSGEPYIMHPLSVAMIASAEMGLGSTSICSALLHDVVEDTDYTVEDIETIFGQKVAQIVDGLTKISGGIFGYQASAQAENFKKLLLTMSDDIRVILLKICDRLHNMRTLSSQPSNKQYKIAGETLYIYAPLANRLGLNKIKNELEDLSFKYEHPSEYESIKERLAITEQSRNTLFQEFTAPIRESLDRMGMKYVIKARVKAPYSIWTKMQNKHVTFDEIYDILAVRIIFKPESRETEIDDCFKIYVAINKIYDSHPDRMRDWVNQPKANGYQALHVTLMSKQGQWIEVQIRSERMDDIAEQGFAAHWKYKSGEGGGEDTELNDWLHTIKEILDDPQPDAMDFLDTIKLNLFASEIFVFTPKGEMRTMPAGSTALDFAFQIHTFVGSHCIGAKVNHKLVPLSHKLRSGDQVEILTSKSQHVDPSWVNFASTAKAKAKIQAILRRSNREIQKTGENTLREFLEEHGLELTSGAIERLCELHDIDKPEKFFLSLGNKTIILSERDIDELLERKAPVATGWRRLVPSFLSGEKKEKERDRQNKDDSDTPALILVTKDFNRKKTFVVNDDNIRRLVFPTCCRPIPGDDILGFIDNKNHIIIHRRDCEVAARLKSSFGNRIIDAKWDMHRRTLFDATLQITGIDRIGLLNEVTSIISSQFNVNMQKLVISCRDGIFEGIIELRVYDRQDMRTIIEALKKLDDLKEINQIQ